MGSVLTPDLAACSLTLTHMLTSTLPSPQFKKLINMPVVVDAPLNHSPVGGVTHTYIPSYLHWEKSVLTQKQDLQSSTVGVNFK